MPRKRGWKLAESKLGTLNPKKRRQTDLTGDTGPGDRNIPSNSTQNDSDCQSKLAGDPVLLNNRTGIFLNKSLDKPLDIPLDKPLGKPLESFRNDSHHRSLRAPNTSHKSLLAPNNTQNSFIKAKNSFNKSQKSVCNSDAEILPYNAIYMKFGTFDQYDERFDKETRGNQCTCNALVFLSVCSHKDDARLVDPDKVLLVGNDLYKNTAHELKRKGKFKNFLFNLDEIPTLFEIPEGKYKVCKKDILFGSAVHTDDTNEFLTLQQCLSEAFILHNTVLIMIGKICSGVFCSQNKYFFFDSHSHGKSGLCDEFSSGTSIIIGFKDIDDLVNYLYAFYTSMFISLQDQFEILPLQITVNDTASILQQQMKNYFAYQEQRNPEKTTESCQVLTKSRSMYFKLYKQKRRRDPLFRGKEQIKELNAKREARQDKEFKNKEADDKRTARQDPVFRGKEKVLELNAKRTARQDPVFRGKEKLKELHAKREAREDEEFKKKEADDKRTARQDPVFRGKERLQELCAKREAREEKEFKNKEADEKRTARQDPVFRGKEKALELNAKRTARQDPVFRGKEKALELDAKRTARQDPVFRGKEKILGLNSKKEARKSEEQRSQDAQFKRNARNDKEYVQIETAKDLERKRQDRLDPDVLAKERLSKQTSRNKNRSKDTVYNKLVKRDKRKDQSFVQHESSLKKKSVSGSHLIDCIRKFEEKMSVGPIYICCSCHQTWFSDSVVNANTIKSSSLAMVTLCVTNLKSVDGKQWICHTCLNALKANKIPRLSIANKMGFPKKVKELDLYPLEERLISLRIPFMQIRQLPRGGQLSVKGNVVNVPVDVQPTINSLPRNIDQSGTISVKLKKKLAFKSCDFSENVRPLAVICALHYLMRGSELYKTSGIHVDNQWVQEVENVMSTGAIDAEAEQSNDTQKDNNNDNKEDDDSDNFSEVDESDLHVGNTDTLLDEVCEENSHTFDKEYTFAPGEGQHPLSLYYDEDAEYLSFPTIFCGQRRPDNKERTVKVHYTDIVKWELRSMDRRVAQSVPNIFFKLKKIQLKNISDKVHLALRRCKSDGKQYTAKDILNPSTVNQLVRLDEGYYILRTLRNSPVYLEKKKKDLFAMIRQLGLPKWFGSFSSADTRWNELLRVLGKLNDGKDYSDSDLENMSWQDKTRLVQKDPVTCSRFFDYRVQQFIKIILKSEHNPIGKITDFFYRVEFQQRGSPHIHILIWIESAPTYKQDSNEDIVSYIDQYVSCANVPELKNLIDLQIHKHAKTCRKRGNPVCRFGFPLPPFRKTVILEPLETDVDNYKAIYKEVQKKIDSLSDLENVEHMTFEKFLTEVLEMSEEEYIKVIRSNLNGPKVFLQRRPSEVRINPYMKIVLSAWKANHDLQFVLDPYACAIYIVSYISKSQKGMSALLDQAAKEARQGNLDLKRQVRHIGNYFTNSVETCAQEAIYLLLQMPLTKATRQVVFINTSPSEKRTFLLKTTSTLEKMSPDSTDIEAENDIKRYSNRPKALENWCLADYISQLEVTFPKKQSSSEGLDETGEASENEFEHDDEDALIDDSTDRINIELKNGVTIKQRKSYRVIRYVRFNKKNDPENFYRERLMLFYPWRNETNLKCKHETYDQMYKTVSRFVEQKAKQYEHNAEELDKAQEQAEHDCNQFDELAPGTQQTELEDIEEGSTDAYQYVHFNPERPANQTTYDISGELGMSHVAVELSTHAKRIKDDDYSDLIRCLNIKQREFFIHVITWIKTKQEPIYAFLTGGAGVGKSVVVKAIFQSLHRYLCSTEGEDPDNIRILLCAPTGKAAYNINGVTIHNAFQIQPSKGFNQSLSCDVLNTLRTKYRNLSVIMIDEISMVGNRMFSLLDTRLKKIKGSNEHFGGVSLIAIGDFFQLKPVFDGWIFEDQSKGITALAPNLWKDLFTVHELTEIMRQKDDIEFAQLLNRLRVNELTENDVALLNTRNITTMDQNYPSTTTHLFRENALVDNFNVQYISQLTSEKVEVLSVDTISADVSESIKKKLISSLPKNQSDTANLARVVELAIGMKYDLTANINVDDGLTNGSSCEVELLEYKTNTPRPSIVWVKFTDDKIGSNTRQKYRHLYNDKVDKSWTPIFDIKRSFVYRFKTFDRIQFPLRPSAGKTIHKSQGDTLDRVVVNLGSKSRATVPHIHYVALSRVRSLSGLHIVDMDLSKVSVSNNVREELKRLRSERTLKLCFNPLYTIDDRFFKFVFNNTRSLHAHIKDVQSDPNILDADVIGLAETRLITNDSYEQYDLQGYNFYRTDQEQVDYRRRPPHGLALYVRDNLIVEDIRDFSCPDFEFVTADIVGSKECIQVVVIYKSPKCKFQDFKDFCLNELMPCISVKHSNLLIMGDFNFDIQKNDSSSFLGFMEQTFHCNQIVTKQTTDYGTTLDLVFINPDVIVISDVLEAYWSDHNIVYTAVDLS